MWATIGDDKCVPHLLIALSPHQHGQWSHLGPCNMTKPEAKNGFTQTTNKADQQHFLTVQYAVPWQRQLPPK